MTTLRDQFDVSDASMRTTLQNQTTAVMTDLVSKGWKPINNPAVGSSGGAADNASHQSLLARIK